MEKQPIVIPVLESHKREAFLAVLHASTAYFRGALAAAKRYAARDGFNHLTEDDLVAALTAIHALAMREIVNASKASEEGSHGR